MLNLIKIYGFNLFLLLLKKIIRMKEMPDIIDTIERKRLQWYGHVKRMQDERLPKLIMEWIPEERRKRGRPRKTWLEGVRAAMKTRPLEADQWLTLRRLMSYIYGAPILDVSRSHTTTQHSR